MANQHKEHNVDGHLILSILVPIEFAHATFYIGRISYILRDINVFCSKKLDFPIPPLFDALKRVNALRYQRNPCTVGKSI